jgi:PleD family two-component response regulator
MGTDSASLHPKPLVVLASRETGELRDIETALFSAGYRVVTARNEHETLQRVRNHQPDAIILDAGLGDSHFELCRTLRAEPTLSPASPIIMTHGNAAERITVIEALNAGAWELEDDPPHVEALLLRLGVYLEAKIEVDRLMTECMIDRPSGLYNSTGFTQRAQELAAFVLRQGLPSACAVFRPVGEISTPQAADRLGRAFRSVGRLSDAIGRTAQTEFAVFAPATNAWAAARLMTRMRDQVSLEAGYMPERGQRVTLRSAYSAALPSQKIEAKTLLERARLALDTTPA